MAHNFKRRIAEIQRSKEKYTARGDFAEAGRLCNVAGELCSANGAFEEACEYHKEEVRYSEIINDRIGEAVGHRKVGECLCQLGDFEGALNHQRKHLKYARGSKNLTEEQRALATIGRTLYLQSDGMEYPESTLMEAQKAYLESLGVCDKLKSVVSEKELLEMRCRLYLNLGLVFEFKQELGEAVRFVKKALVTSSEFKLKETMYRCFLSLSCILGKQSKNSEALQYARKAQHISKDMSDHSLEADAWMQLGQMLLSLGNFAGCKDAFKKTYSLSPSLVTNEFETFARGFKLAVEGDDLLTKLECDQPLEERMKLYEKLGDVYSECKSLGLAIACYKKQLALAMELHSSEKVCGPIYISLAITYSENKDYDKALECYEKELKLRVGEPKENADTYCAIAKVQEDSGCDFEIVSESYLKAVNYAQQCGRASVLQKVYKEYLDTLIKSNKAAEAAEIKQRIESIDKSKNCGDDDDTQSQEMESETDWQLESSQLFRLLEDNCDESDDAEDDDLEITEVIPGKRKGKHSRKGSKKKLKKVNAKGETPLHTASISGHLQEVKALLQTGADVHARDYCGWQPLHEAANHGHDEIVEALLQAGAYINDAGGQHCHGITPLHDAAQNGHLSTVKLLIARGANVHVRDAFNNSPIDTVVNALKAQEEEEVQESDMMKDRKEVLAFLRSVSKGPSPSTTGIRRRDLLLTNGEVAKEVLPSAECINRNEIRRQYNTEQCSFDMNVEAGSDTDGNCNEFVDDLFSMDFENDSDSNYASMDDEDHGREVRASANETLTTDRGPNNVDLFRDTSSHKLSNSHSRNDTFGSGRSSKSPFYSTSTRGSLSLDPFIIDDLNLNRGRQRPKERTRSSTGKKRSVKQSKITECKASKRWSSIDDRVVENSKKSVHKSSKSDGTSTTQRPNSSHLFASYDTSPKRAPANSSDPTKIIRIRVKIKDQIFLVPCRGDAKVSFLTTEIMGRCKPHFKNLSGLDLFTEEGAMLYPDDMMSYVLVDNSIVSATPNDYSSLSEETGECSDIEEIRQFIEGQERMLEVHDEYLTLKDVKFITKGLLKTPDIKLINFAGCCFNVGKYSGGSDAVKELINTIVDLTGLENVDFSSCYANLFPQFVGEALDMRLKGGQYAFSRLEHLKVSCIPFPNNQDWILSSLFQSCLSLRSLSLQNCNLFLCKTFSNKDVVEYFSQLQNLRLFDISGNTMCETNDPYNSGLFAALLKLQVEEFNISDTKGLALCEHQFTEDVTALIERAEPTLKRLVISNCFHTVVEVQDTTLKFWDAVCKQRVLVTLDAGDSSIDITITKSIASRIAFCTSLTDLKLAGSKSFDRNCLIELLKPIGQCGSSLNRVNLSCTGISSPLLRETYSLVSKCKSLLVLDMTECTIDQSEKERLLVAWKICHSRNNGTISDFFCVLSKHTVE